MMTYAQLKKAIVHDRDYKDAYNGYPVMIRLADGNLISVKAVEMTPNHRTGEMSIVLDTREMV